jgi:diaminopimelate epimerase
MRFAKLHGLGNDFVLLDLRARALGGAAQVRQLTRDEAVRLCDRHLGVGADGVLTLLDEEGADARLVIQNSDGSVPEMCGNGARCAALWILTQGGTRAAEGRVELVTPAGPRPCTVAADSPLFGEVEVAMGVPRIDAQRALPVGGRQVEATPVSMGNPHLVIFPDAEAQPHTREQLTHLAVTAGRALCAAENANVELVARLGPQRYAVSVWERGAGLTQACGTGACAVAAAAIARGYASPREPIEVELPGGALRIRLDPGTGQLLMRGPAQLVFRGESLPF